MGRQGRALHLAQAASKCPGTQDGVVFHMLVSLASRHAAQWLWRVQMLPSCQQCAGLKGPAVTVAPAGAPSSAASVGQ